MESSVYFFLTFGPMIKRIANQVDLSGIQLKGFQVFLLLLALTFLVRFLTFFPTVFDQDESTYIIIAKQLLSGKIPYVDSIEIKPIGIFLFFATALKLFGHSVLSIRLLSIIMITLTGFMLYLAKQSTANRRQAVWVGVAYIIMSSIHQWTWSPNTEIYFNAFTAGGLLILLRAKKPLHYFWLGLIMGMGFMIKYMVIFDMAAFGLYFLVSSIPKQKKISVISSVLLISLGFLIPLAITSLVYKKMGYWDEFVFATITAPSRYISEYSVLDMGSFLGEILAAYFPLSLLFLYSIYYILTSGTYNRAYRVLALSWSILVWLAIFLPGKLFHHYAFQALVPISFFMFDAWETKAKISRVLKPVYLISLFLLLIIVTLSMQFKYLLNKPDYPKMEAEYLNGRMEKEDRIFVMGSHIVYFLCQKEAPLKYIHTSLMIRKDHVKTFMIDQAAEFQKIKELQPRFIVVEGDAYMTFTQLYLEDMLKEHYKISKTWNSDQIVCFERF